MDFDLLGHQGERLSAGNPENLDLVELLESCSIYRKDGSSQRQALLMEESKVLDSSFRRQMQAIHQESDDDFLEQFDNRVKQMQVAPIMRCRHSTAFRKTELDKMKNQVFGVSKIDSTSAVPEAGVKDFQSQKIKFERHPSEY